MQGLDRIVGGFHHDVNILEKTNFPKTRLEAKLGWKPPVLDLLRFFHLYFLGGERYWKPFQKTIITKLLDRWNPQQKPFRK